MAAKVRGRRQLAVRPARIYAHFMLFGSVCSALVAVWLLTHSWAGVVVYAEGRPGTAITMPTPATGGLDVYAVRDPGPRPDVTCELATTGRAWVSTSYVLISAKSRGRVLEPVANINSGWNSGDTLTCTGIGVKTLVLGHNAGLTYLVQGLMATVLALGSGLIALIGFASKRYRAGGAGTSAASMATRSA